MMSLETFWQEDEIKQLSMALTFAYKNSDTYGQPLELQSRVDAFKFCLEGEYDVEDILGAIKQHMKKSSEMVKPSHVNLILSPVKPEITQTEFIHAQKQWERDGFKAFCPHKEVIDAYRKQEEDVREEHAQITDKRVLKLLGKYKRKEQREVTTPNGYKLLTDEDNVTEDI